MQVVRTYTPQKTKSFNDGYDAYATPPFWMSDAILRQGSYMEDEYTQQGPFYGAMGDFRNTVGGATLAAELTGKTGDIVSARIRLTRYSSPSNNKNVRIRRATGITAAAFPGSGAHSPRPGYSDAGGGSLPLEKIGTTAGSTFWLAGDLATMLNLIDWLIAGNCICTHYGLSHYARFYGAGANLGYVPLLEITTEEAPPAPPVPAPSAPVFNAVEPVKDANHRFAWEPATDASGIFSASDLSYELQVSKDGGATWGETIAVDPNVTTKAVDLVTYLDLAATPHYYNANCKFQVRTVTPAYDGTVYYSEWAVSPSFAIDYRIVLNLPVLYAHMKVHMPETDFGNAFALKIVSKIRIRGKGGTLRITPIADGVMGLRETVELPDEPGIVDAYVSVKGKTIGFDFDNGDANEDGGYDPVEVYDRQFLYDVEEE